MNFEELIFSQEYNYSQDYSLGHGSGHGSAPVQDDEDDFPVKEVSPIKPKKPSRHATRAKKDEPKEPPKDWIMAEETALCQAWYFEKETGLSRGYHFIVSKWKIRVHPRIGAFCAINNNVEENHESGTNDLDVYHKACAEYKMMYKQDFALEHYYNILKDHPGWKDIAMPAFYNTQGRKKSKTSETTSGSAFGGLNLNEKADEAVEETQEFRPMGRDRAKAKKKAAGSSRGGSSSFVDLVADKFFNIKQKMGKEGRATTVLYSVQESGVEYPGGRGSRNCTAEKRETRNSASNA
ncbi:retrotransposon protein, putative, ty3-gypsy subclass [Tanacetum coccineum]|uniref:Retrotransposon protein, putative, ty3-gypsy subclass n=1 Tax=Tanacetum coccineum TaxID=301880 RepID=A0ABQ5D7H9_9ASTR